MQFTRAGVKKNQNHSGQAVLEYILLLSIVAVLVTGFSRTIVKTFDKGVLSFGAQFEKRLKTGRVPVNVWTN